MIGDGFDPGWTHEPRTGFRLCRRNAGDRAYDVALSMPQCVPPEGGFPLLLVMDAALHFDAVAAAAQALARRPAKTGVDPIAVLGIASGPRWTHDAQRRERDLLPDGAGSEALHALTIELIGELAGNGLISAGRCAIFGHSFGGLFALDAVARAPARFAACVAISPSFARAPGLAARVAEEAHRTRILIASGALEPAQVNADIDAAAKTLAPAMRIILPREDHGAIAFAALPMTLRFVHGITR